jgi:hypothetical protein
MPTADDVTAEIMGTNPPANHHDTVMGDGGPNPYTGRTMQDKLSHIAHEIMFWLPRRSVKDLQVDNVTKKDTTLGHSIDAASFGRVNFQILKRLADKAGVDISDLL